jgi:histone deacetylase 1/2
MLQTESYHLNRRSCRATGPETPHQLLLGSPPRYDELRVFGCLCCPNTTSTAAHTLSPRSVACVFIGYPGDHRGYRCYDITTRRAYTSRCVVFVEDQFPFRTPTPPPRSPLPNPCICDPVILHTPPPVHHGHHRASLLWSHPPRALQATPRPHASVARALSLRVTPTAMPSPMHVKPMHVEPASTPPHGNADQAASSSQPTTAPQTIAHPPQHPMVTRAKDGTRRPNPKYTLMSSTPALSSTPTSVRAALQDPNWRAAMQQEFDALQANGTWSLVH